jgi:putative flavoprotein involved in K+ transport
MPRRYGRWPRRDDLVQYLREYARYMGLRVRPRIEVERIERAGLGWRLRTSAGDLDARCAVVTTGHDHDALVPDWPGREDFPGDLLHSSSYREPSPFRGRDVLVVSARNSGSEIASSSREEAPAACAWRCAPRLTSCLANGLGSR